MGVSKDQGPEYRPKGLLLSYYIDQKTRPPRRLSDCCTLRCIRVRMRRRNEEVSATTAVAAHLPTLPNASQTLCERLTTQAHTVWSPSNPRHPYLKIGTFFCTSGKGSTYAFLNLAAPGRVDGMSMSRSDLLQLSSDA